MFAEWRRHSQELHKKWSMRTLFLLVPTSGGSIPDRGSHGAQMQVMYAAVYCQTCENCDTGKGCMLQYIAKRVKTVKTVENRSWKLQRNKWRLWKPSLQYKDPPLSSKTKLTVFTICMCFFTKFRNYFQRFPQFSHIWQYTAAGFAVAVVFVTVTWMKMSSQTYQIVITT